MERSRPSDCHIPNALNWRTLAMHGCMAVSLLMGSHSFAASAKVAADRLADSALSAATRSTDPAIRTRVIAAARLETQARSSRSPEQLSKAHVVLGRGYSPKEIQNALSAGGLELMQLEAKIPVPGSDEVYTVILSGTALEETAGTVAARITTALATTQAEFRKLAAAEPASRTKYTALSRNPMLVYAFDSIGTNASLAELAASRDVQVVQPLQGDEASVELEGQRALRTLMQPTRTTASVGTNATVICNLSAPSPVASASTSDAGTMVVVSPSVICPPEPSDDPIPTPTTPLPVPSGDAFVDSGLSGSTQFIDSFKDTVGPSKIQLPPSHYLDCDSSTPGSLCPNDNTYTTRAETGGFLAWGAGLQQAGGPINTVECTLIYNAPGNDTVGSYSWYCYRVVINRPKWTYVSTVSRFSFGGVQVEIPISPGMNVASIHKVSTFAWSGIPKRADGWPERCIPTGGTWDVSRPCNFTDLNGSWVQGQSGFEDKIVIPNPSCHTVLGRLGTTGDKNNGCFSPDRVITNLPTAYLDTTFQDPDNQFVASVGVADGKLLTADTIGVISKIGNPFRYEVRIDGSMKGWENVRGLTARHLQAVTARDDSGAPCITGVGGAPAGGGAACMFNVDLTRVGPDAIFR